ncbi:MAG: capsule biosynthesis protein CapC [Candidatus Parvarchaeota archaeon]|nr:capsule biosynthesis protein CapC [Candidatus Jingweiarchaeum tengchongense]
MLIDIHTHFLPGVDDGCETIEESLSLLNKCKLRGVDVVYLTPHVNHPSYKNKKPTLVEVYAQFKAQLESTGVKTYLGSEVYLTPDLNLDDVIPLGNTPYVLIETALDILPVYLPDMLFKLQLNGFTPILAHVERFVWLQRDTHLQNYLKDHGVKFQINYVALSKIKSNPILKKYLSNGWIEFVGSDVHHDGDGRVLLQKSREIEKFNLGLLDIDH